MLPGAATFDFAAILAVFSRVLRRDSILYPWDVEICRVAGSFDVSVRTAVFLSSVYLSSTFPRGGVDMGIVSHLTKGCNSDLRDGFLGSIPGTDCWDGLSGRICPALALVSARSSSPARLLDSPNRPMPAVTARSPNSHVLALALCRSWRQQPVAMVPIAWIGWCQNVSAHSHLAPSAWSIWHGARM